MLKSDIQLDQKIIDKLLSFCNPGYAPGALLYNFNTNSITKQHKCIYSILRNINAQYVLETGTESGMFCYFAKCVNPNIKIVTFGMNEGCNETGDMRSKKCTDFLNNTFGEYIQYIEGDSRVTLTNFNTDKKIDFAWIDGGHTSDILMKDLKNSQRLNIPHICIDDYNMVPEVRETVEKFLGEVNIYTKQYVTDEERGICYITL
jgi:hypothetical protein